MVTPENLRNVMEPASLSEIFMKFEDSPEVDLMVSIRADAHQNRSSPTKQIFQTGDVCCLHYKQSAPFDCINIVTLPIRLRIPIVKPNDWVTPEDFHWDGCVGGTSALLLL